MSTDKEEDDKLADSTPSCESARRAADKKIVDDSHRYDKSKKQLDIVHSEMIKDGPPELDLKNG